MYIILWWKIFFSCQIVLYIHSVFHVLHISQPHDNATHMLPLSPKLEALDTKQAIFIMRLEWIESKKALLVASSVSAGLVVGTRQL